MATRFNPPIGYCVFIVTRAAHRPLRAVLTWFIVSPAVAGEEGEMEDNDVDTTVQGVCGQALNAKGSDRPGGPTVATGSGRSAGVSPPASDSELG